MNAISDKASLAWRLMLEPSRLNDCAQEEADTTLRKSGNAYLKNGRIIGGHRYRKSIGKAILIRIGCTALVWTATGTMANLPLDLGIFMNGDLNHINNPLHGIGLKKLLTEIVDHYGFEILFAYLNINCFNKNPSIDSSVKFLKKTDWAREKVEAFYLYQFKGLPRASDEQFELPPRDRIIPPGQTPGAPAELSLEDAERLCEKRAQKAATWSPDAGHRATPVKRVATSSRAPIDGDSDPWAKWKK